jgi:FtsZ-binding cell division protein ZapB
MIEKTQNRSVDKKNNIIVIVLSVLLVVVATLFFLQRSQHSTLISEINADKDSITVELSRMIAGYDSLSTENDTINKSLDIAQTHVRDLLTEVELVKKTSYKQISMYKAQVTTLKKVMKDLYVQVDSLNARNELLLAENIEVKRQVSQVKNVNIQLQMEKKKLEQKVSLASQLEALNLIASGINKKGKDSPKATKIEKIKVSFTLSKNVTAKRGAKDIYVRIQQPNEVVMVKSEKDLFRFEDLKISYSALREVEYEGKELPVNIYWDNTNEPLLKKGVYTVDVFTAGSNIGTTKFLVK